MRKTILFVAVLLPLVLPSGAFATGGGGGGGGGDSGPRSGDNANACVTLVGDPINISSTRSSRQVRNTCSYAISVTSTNACGTNGTTISAGSSVFIENARCDGNTTYPARVF
jgi:hypothetical protein